MPLFGTAKTDEAFEIRQEPGPIGSNSLGLYRELAAAEKALRNMYWISGYRIFQVRTSIRCNDEWYDPTESEWQK